MSFAFVCVLYTHNDGLLFPLILTSLRSRLLVILVKDPDEIVVAVDDTPFTGVRWASGILAH